MPSALTQSSFVSWKVESAPARGILTSSFQWLRSQVEISAPPLCPTQLRLFDVEIGFSIEEVKTVMAAAERGPESRGRDTLPELGSMKKLGVPSLTVDDLVSRYSGPVRLL